MVLPYLMGVLNSIGGRCLGWIEERISTEAGHLISYGENIETLRTQVQDLTDGIESLQNRIESAANRGETLVDPVVVRLLERMTTLEAEASSIISDEERSSDCTCIIRLQPNLWACYRTSKSAKKTIDEAIELVEEEIKHDRPVANVDHSKSLGVTPNPDFEELESWVLASNQIVGALKDPNVHRVGVYGMGGTGKTTLAKQIGAELQLNGIFSYVVLATVSEKQSLLQNNYQSDMISIQKQIAGGLKIQLLGETVNDRATQLCEQLQKKDKLLIILDDIWSKFELENVGIPVGRSITSKFQILMTSKSKIVLENEMDSTNNFKLDSLPIDDAQNLFDKMVGGDAHYSKWPLIAHQVVELCGGVPILLVTIGRALRNATQSVWEDALTQLKRFDGEDIDKEGYKKIEVSYNFLENEELKKLFLLCAQLDHRSIPIDDLLKYAMRLNLFKGRKKVKEVSSRLHKYLRDLKGCCLLQDRNEEGIIKMHDVIHKFAFYVASRDHDVFSVANDGELEEWPSKDEFENFSTISLRYCRLPLDHMLPPAFHNPKLESFLMLRSDIDASFKIPDNFFAAMKGLKLMNLTRMSLSPILVSSLSALVKLRTLCLDHCELSDITMICGLPVLQALSLVGSSIVLVAKEMGQLGGSLKLLDLRDCLKLQMIAAGVISRLILMEDLRIGKSFKAWQRLEGSNKSSDSDDVTSEAGVASLEEFKKLQNLINIEIHVSEHAKMFPKDLVFKKLKTFKIFIGTDIWYNPDFLLPKALLVDESSAVVEFGSEGSEALMTTAECLGLAGVMSCVSVSEMDPKGFPELKQLEVEEGYGIQYIVKKNYNNCIFPKLETLDSSELFKLEKICDDHQLPAGSFENLRDINVYKCPLLNHLLSSNLAKDLLRLREIRVTHCGSMESIIGLRESENDEEIKIGFTHQLHVLILSTLPHLVSFCNFKQIEGLSSPTSLFNKTVVLPKLEDLKLFHMKVERIWDDAGSAPRSCWVQNLTTLFVRNCSNLHSLAPPSPTSFKNLTTLDVFDCPMLIKLVVSSSIAKSLVNLKKMSVSSCGSLEEIVGIDDQWEELVSNNEYIVFDKLETLGLIRLDSLISFCSISSCNFRFPSLKRLSVEKCPKMQFFSKGALSTPKLLRVEVDTEWLYKKREKIAQIESRWEGDVNSTIRQMFEDKVWKVV